MTELMSPEVNSMAQRTAAASLPVDKWFKIPDEDGDAGPAWCGLRRRENQQHSGQCQKSTSKQKAPSVTQDESPHGS